MLHTYYTYWVFRDDYPVKRFIGQNAGNKARLYAEEVSYNYPGSVVRCSLQTLMEADVFTIPAKTQEQPKVMRDA